MIALLIALWRGHVADRQASATQHQAATSQQQLLDEQHRQGAAMLGSDLLPVRLAGIYALRRLAESYPMQYHIQVMRLLCAFARRPPTLTNIESGPAATLREDVAAAIEAISACHESQQDIEQALNFRLDLRALDLSCAQFARLNLSGAHLVGGTFVDANLQEANFAEADLMNARFCGRETSEEVGGFGESSSLAGAILAGANLRNAKLIGVDLRSANLSRAFLNGADLSEASLFAADLAGARMTAAVLTRTRFFSDPTSAAIGLTQQQLDSAYAASSPELGTLHDAKTGERLWWRDDPPPLRNP